MIVVVGCPAARFAEGNVSAAGLTGRIAVHAAEAGAAVQLVGRIGDDALGDAVVLALAQAGVGHAAVLRDPAWSTLEDVASDEWAEGPAGVDGGAELATPPGGAKGGPRLDAADVALGLRYLTEFSVLVVADALSDAALGAAVEAAQFAGARVVVIGAAEGPASRVAGVDDVLEAPEGDAEAFAAMVGRYAAALAGGAEPDVAFRAAVAWAGWQPAGHGASPA